MEDLIAAVASSLVDAPESVKVRLVDDEENYHLELSVAHQDLGKVIGKQGRTARAMRRLLAAAAAKQGRTSRLDIVE
ncbi:KH domain-containing protein [Desulforhopalus vacuolatus]|uniref:KH domain-containing protein n=1 Tax=Desulforhopalus vacuolatus TaxID=40414 RepID=UPI0019627703|nr:KH domain-containing protein [Desulforhopalus vacuolatus]MBM9519810.1 KH domain-containing protein [Desulforhopalus vacuolatus]